MGGKQRIDVRGSQDHERKLEEDVVGRFCVSSGRKRHFYLSGDETRRKERDIYLRRTKCHHANNAGKILYLAEESRLRKHGRNSYTFAPDLAKILFMQSDDAS